MKTKNNDAIFGILGMLVLAIPYVFVAKFIYELIEYFVPVHTDLAFAVLVVLIPANVIFLAIGGVLGCEGKISLALYSILFSVTVIAAAALVVSAPFIIAHNIDVENAKANSSEIATETADEIEATTTTASAEETESNGSTSEANEDETAIVFGSNGSYHYLVGSSSGLFCDVENGNIYQSYGSNDSGLVTDLSTGKIYQKVGNNLVIDYDSCDIHFAYGF